MSDLVGNPEDRFYHNEAQLFCVHLQCKDQITIFNYLIQLEIKTNTKLSYLVEATYSSTVSDCLGFLGNKSVSREDIIKTLENMVETSLSLFV